MADIFLSYAREDEERARVVAAGLESRGWSVFWDRRIPTGHDFGEVHPAANQHRALHRCAVVEGVSRLSLRTRRSNGGSRRQTGTRPHRTCQGRWGSGSFRWPISKIGTVRDLTSSSTGSLIQLRRLLLPHQSRRQSEAIPLRPPPHYRNIESSLKQPGRASPDRQAPIAGVNFDADVLISAAPWTISR